MRDIVNNIGVVAAIAPAVLAATTSSGALDLATFDSAMVAINTGAIVGSGDFTAKLQECDDASTWVDVPAAQLNGSLPASLTANGVFKIGYAGWKRYLQVVVTKNSGTSIAAGAVLIKGSPRNRPVA